MLVEVLIDFPFVPGGGGGSFGLLRFSFTLKISPFLFQFYLERTRSQSAFFIGKQTTLKFTTPGKGPSTAMASCSRSNVSVVRRSSQSS